MRIRLDFIKAFAILALIAGAVSIIELKEKNKLSIDMKKHKIIHIDSYVYKCVFYGDKTHLNCYYACLEEALDYMINECGIDKTEIEIVEL